MIGTVENHIVTSDLLNDTLIRNMSNGTMDPNLIAVRPADRDKQLSAEEKFSNDSLSDADSGEKQVITFEFGIPNNHLIFSKPVYLSVDAGDIPDGSWVDLLVLHA